MSNFELVETAHGSALRDVESGETMHPNGPTLEGVRLYAEPARLAQRLAQPGEPLVLFDVGLGAGSNALAAWRVGQRVKERALHIYSFERTLGPLAFALEHAEAFALEPEAQHALRGLLEHGKAAPHWELRLGDLREQLAGFTPHADVVFWDPYSPRTQPMHWGVEAFTALRGLCRDGATVHTFSAATSVRSAMLLAGFYVGYVPALGVKQKRSTVAATSLADLSEPLDLHWLRSLGRSGLSFDAPEDALERLARHPQFAR